MHKITVIIPIYNAQKDVALCLQSIAANINYKICNVICIDDCSNYEICNVICIDDCSNYETANFVNQFCRKHSFQYLRNDENLGFVKTCNRGMKLASGEIVVLLNSDTIIPKNFCEKIIKCFESDENIGISSPIATHSGAYYIEKPLNYNIDKCNKLLEKYHNTKYPDIFNGEGFCFCIRRSVIESLGYLDEIYGFGYCEEVDYSHKAQSKGYKCVLIDNLYVYHKRHSSFGIKRREKQLAVNEKIFKSRWHEFENNMSISLENNPCREIEKKIYNGTSLFDIQKWNDKIIIKIFGTRVSIKRK